MTKRYSNIIGFDDAPFTPDQTAPVSLIGTVFTGLKLTGVVTGQVAKDGLDATDEVIRLVTESRFDEHVNLVMLQGIAFAGFNVVDAFALYEKIDRPVLVVSRRMPDMEAVREALLRHIPNGTEKWAVIERLGPPEAAGNVFVQRVGLTLAEATATVERFAIHSHLPEPLRTAHLIAGAIGRGESRGRP